MVAVFAGSIVLTINCPLAKKLEDRGEIKAKKMIIIA